MCKFIRLLPGLTFTRQESLPLKLDVTLTDSDQIISLRNENEDLRQQLYKLQDQYSRTEYLYRCESLINMQIIDIAREHGIDIPKRLKTRPNNTAPPNNQQE